MSTIRKSTEFTFNDKLEWEQIGEGITRKIMSFDENIMLVKLHFESGAAGTIHNHPHTQVSYIQDGEYQVTIGDEIKILKAGDSFYIPSNVMHGVTCIKEGILLDVFSPIREDFLVNK